MLHVVQENDTRWFSTYLMIVRAIILRNSINLFVLRYQTLAKDEKNLLKFTFTTDDWNYYLEVNAFIKPLFLLVKELEGKSSSSTYTLCFLLVFITN
jgi:hypothetical protein